MALDLIAPVPVMQCRALYAGGLALGGPTMARIGTLQPLLASASFGMITPAWELAVAVLFWRHPDGSEEMAIAVDKRHLPPTEVTRGVLLARLITRSRIDTGITAIRAQVATGHRPGERMARMIGMRRIHDEAGQSVWELKHG